MEPLAVLALAIVTDAIIGDPSALYRRVPHPIVIIGRVIAWLEKKLYREAATPPAQVLAGAGLVLACVALWAAIGDMLHTALSEWPFGYLAEALLVAVLLAARSLHDHVHAVLTALARGLEEGRTAVGHIVGRDPATLDEPAVVRAAIESAAENFSDGFVAPVFWYVLLGLPGLLIYKAINTLDSMIGHRTPRYLYFGRVAARLDDVVNWLPARLTGLVFCVSAFAVRGARPLGAWRAMWRDARKHRSVNAGWCEAALAGALDLALAGPRQYDGVRIEDAWMGNGRSAAEAVDLERALHLYRAAWATVAALVALAFVLT